MDIQSQIAWLSQKVESLESRLSRLESKKKSKSVESTPGSKVWDAYSNAIRLRHKVEPVRNAKTNRNCVDLVTRLGEMDAIAVVAFYVTLNDPQFTRLNHPLGLCLFHCESIHASWQKGRMTTRAEAGKMEKRSSNISASQSYLERKYARKDQR